MTKMFALLVALCFGVYCQGADDARVFGPVLQDLSVNVKSGGDEGSGVIVTRERKTGNKVEHISFIWTAGHVVADLRSVHTVLDGKGNSSKRVEFKDAAIVKEVTQNGRRVGESKMDVKVIKYSDAKNGEDLALLQVVAPDFSDKNTDFYLKDTSDKEIVPVGTTLYHVGCLLGQMGANSFTTGVMSQVGRVNDQKVYDQTSVTAFPGSSGGGVWMLDNGKPVYVGTLVRGAGETFNLIVPVRRMHDFAKKYKLEWAMDKKVALPSQDDIDKIAVEEGGASNDPLDDLVLPTASKPMAHPNLNDVDNVKMKFMDVCVN